MKTICLLVLALALAAPVRADIAPDTEDWMPYRPAKRSRTTTEAQLPPAPIPAPRSGRSEQATLGLLLSALLFSAGIFRHHVRQQRALHGMD